MHSAAADKFGKFARRLECLTSPYSSEVFGAARGFLLKNLKSFGDLRCLIGKENINHLGHERISSEYYFP
jgi:hypothetical protein